MASSFKDYLTTEECLKIIRARRPSRSRSVAKKLLQLLISEGLLVEDFVWQPEEQGGPIKVIRLPYQRFSDHIIARSLLRHIDTSNESTIRRSLASQPLNRLFGFKYPHHPEFEFTGWVEALIVEFPERVKNTLPASKRELFFYLPDTSKDLNAYYKPFIGGLFWRSSNSISEQTDQIVGSYIWLEEVYLAAQMLEAMLAVATKPEHPYNADRLYLNLSKMTLQERDLHWSEFLRQRSHSSTIERLIRWFEIRTPRGLSDVSALNQIVLLSLILTTTDRTLRDRITRVLVILGERFPMALFQHTVRSLGFNDPYVAERMLAASYGVAMFLRDESKVSSYTKGLCRLAARLAKEMFLPDGRHHSTHILMREYALGIIQLARQVGPQCISVRDSRYLIPPYKGVINPFPDDKAIKDSDCEEGKDAIHMDFGNYSIGRLVSDRSNYDMEHAGYKKIRRKIEWRIANLGYRAKKFQSVDRIIGSQYWNRNDSSEGKVDRYGKKYAWVAYFEMYGYLEQKNLLPDRRKWDRCSDCDIDPSFPLPPKQWLPQLEPLFESTFEDPTQWLKYGPAPNYAALLQPDSVNDIDGPWVLLDGFINETTCLDQREVFTFLRGLFVLPKTLERIEKEYDARPYPGNSMIPEPGDDYYTFGGEVPWSPRFGTYLRDRRGRAKRHLDEMFERYKTKGGKGTKQKFIRIGFLPSKQGPSSPETDDAKSEILVPLPNITRSIKIPGVMVEVPIHRLAWESYHCSLNQISGITLPAPALCELLGLQKKGREWDLYDSNGRIAFLYRQFYAGPVKQRSYLVYLRADLLDLYLSKTKQRLIWLPWGERSLHYELLNKIANNLHGVWEAHAHIHKKLIRHQNNS